MNLGIETEVVEFKKSTSELKEGVISISSMLNKHGHCILYFGVKNDGTVVGQEIGDSTLRDISQMIAVGIKSQVIPTITLELINNKNVIKVEVSGFDQPYSAFGRYYIRSADEDRELNPQQLAKLMQEKIGADTIIAIPANNQNLTFTQLKTLYSAKGLTVNDEFEENIGLFNQNGKYNLLAELLSDKNDISIKIVQFASKDKTIMTQRTEYGLKCLILAMEQVLSYIESINSTNVKLTNHQRIEEELFDFRAFKEAWVNACVHTKWQYRNPPAVYIFSDRIEIISTGGLSNNITDEEFYNGVSKPVNEKLQKIFGQLGYVEQTGHGIPVIINKYGRQAFSLMENFLNVTIPFRKNKEENIVVNHKVELNKSQKAIYDFLDKNPRSRIEDIANEFGYSTTYVKNIINWLRMNGFVERIGSKKTGSWMVH